MIYGCRSVPRCVVFSKLSERRIFRIQEVGYFTIFAFWFSPRTLLRFTKITLGDSFINSVINELSYPFRCMQGGSYLQQVQSSCLSKSDGYDSFFNRKGNEWENHPQRHTKTRQNYPTTHRKSYSRRGYCGWFGNTGGVVVTRKETCVPQTQTQRFITLEQKTLYHTLCLLFFQLWFAGEGPEGRSPLRGSAWDAENV